MRKIVLAMLACVTLAGCVPDNLASLETVPAVVHTTPQAWQNAYRTLNAQIHACSELGGIFPVGVDGQLYDGMGEVLVTYAQGPFTSNKGPVAQVQVRPAAQGAAVSVRSARNPIGVHVADMVPRWLQGDTRCR